MLSAGAPEVQLLPHWQQTSLVVAMMKRKRMEALLGLSLLPAKRCHYQDSRTRWQHEEPLLQLQQAQGLVRRVAAATP